MDKLTFTVNVSVNSADAAKALIEALFNIENAGGVKTSVAAVPVCPAKAEDPKNHIFDRPEVKITEPSPAPTKAEDTPRVEMPTKKSETNVNAISIEDVREMLKAKVTNHREAIKAKLSEFGAPSVSKLSEDKYSDMYQFLKAL